MSKLKENRKKFEMLSFIAKVINSRGFQLSSRFQKNQEISAL